MKYSRRKFLATTASGVVATTVSPVAFAGKQSEMIHKTTEAESKIASNIKMASSTRISPSEFIIFPWGSMPSSPSKGQWGDLADINDLMKDLFDCGFNTSGFTSVRNIRHIRNNHLAGILTAGINANKEVTQEEAEETIQALMASITDPEDRKAIHAIYIRDEPGASLFNKLNIWSEAIKKQGVLPYINLFPDYASPEALGAKDYEEHLEKYVEICKPPYISYDNYSLFENGRLDEDRFFGNIELIRRKSLHSDIPFWNVILSNAHFNYAEPSDATLAIQVYSTLAYGGKGIGYFTYYTPQVGNYRLAPIDRFGYRTRTWEMMRNINLQIHTLAPLYCKLRSINVFHSGNIARNCIGVESAKLVKSISNISLLVGEFTHPDGKPYVMVVNKDMYSSLVFDIEFKEKGQIMIVSQFNQEKVPFQGEQKWLAPGCGVLLTIE
jgi:hypothetical protein